MTSYRMKYKIGNTAYIIPSMDDLSGFGSGGGVPLGTILPYSADSQTPPEGFSFCDGTAVSRSLYADLFDLIGTSYGAGDGETTFNLPDLTDAAWLNGSYEKTAYETAGNYTFTATKPGWYKITIKGAGGGGGGGAATSGHDNGGGGGGEGGTTFTFQKLDKGNTASIAVGAGGAGSRGSVNGLDGENTTITINSTVFTAGGGHGGWGSNVANPSDTLSLGGSGDIPGAPGGSALTTSMVYAGASGGGAGGGVSKYLPQSANGPSASNGILGGGGAGGNPTAGTGTSASLGGNGGDGYCWIEYIGTSQNFIIRTFDEATPSSAQIDLSQYTNALNNKADKADGVPVGTVLPFSGNGSLPAGYLLCDGSAVSRSMYEDLFGVIGTTYGEGDGVETFNLPDLGFVDGESADVYGDGKATCLDMNQAFDANTTIMWYSSSGRTLNYYSPTTDGSSSGVSIATKNSSANPNGSHVYTDLTSAVSNKVRYIIKAFNGMNTHGALLDLTGMANELNRKYDARTDFCYIYPNNGTEENPALAASNSRYIDPNPFPGYVIHCMVEIQYKGQWGSAGFLHVSGGHYYLINSSVLDNDTIITQTGDNGLVVNAFATGASFGQLDSPGNATNLPVRIKVWKIGKI